MPKMSINELMNELDDARLTAKANGQASAMVAATMSKAKLLGLLDNPIKDVYADNKPVVFNITGVSPDEAARAYKDIMS